MAMLDDLLGWNSSCEVKGQYDGTIQLANPLKTYAPSSLTLTPIQIDLDATAVSAGSVSVSVSPFTGVATWIRGLIQSVEDVRGIPELTVNVKVRSFFANLARKPINTYKYDTDIIEALVEILTDFCTISDSLVDYAVSRVNHVKGVVTGANVLEELRKLAQATEADMFVQSNGNLKFETWKDGRDAVDVIIPAWAILSAQRVSEPAPCPTRLRIRGRFISRYNCGPADLNDNENKDNNNSGKPTKGELIVCCENGIEEGECDIPFDHLPDDDEGIANAEILIKDPTMKIKEFKEDGQGNLVASIGRIDGGPMVGSNELGVRALGLVRPNNEVDAANAKMGALNFKVDQQGAAWLRAAAKLGKQKPPKGSGTSQNKQSQNNDKKPDEPELVMMETIVNDTDLQAKYGILVQDYENQYISNHETAFDVGVRLFQELKMGFNSWSVTCKYIPGLELNQVVLFTTPDGESLTGLLQAIRVSWSPEPKADMQLIIAVVNDSTLVSYTSGNLFTYPDLCGTAMATVPWICSNDQKVFASGGFIDITEGEEYVEQTLHDCEEGAEYTLSWIVTGLGTISVDVNNNGTIVSGITVSPYVFTCLGETMKITFRGAVNRCYLSKPHLSKTVVR